MFVCLRLSPSAKEAIFISSREQGAPPGVAVGRGGGCAASAPRTAPHLRAALRHGGDDNRPLR